MLLDDLLKEYGQQIYAQIDEQFWDAARVNGKIYGTLNYQMTATGYGMAAQEDIVSEIGGDLFGMERYKDIEPLLAYIKEKYPDKIPLGYTKTFEPFTAALPMYGFEAVGNATIPGAVKADGSMQIVNQYETEEFKDFITTMNEWYKKEKNRGVNRAILLVREGMGIEEFAYKAGFHTYFHFYKKFKKYYKKSPRAYFDK